METLPRRDGLVGLAQIAVVCLVLGVVYFALSSAYADRPYRQFPLAALPEDGLTPKESWFKKGRKTVSKGIEGGVPFQVSTGTGPKIILPNRYADELKDNPSLSISRAMSKDFFTWYPGFEPFKMLMKDESLMPEVVRAKLTQSLGLIVGDLVEETSAAVEDKLGSSGEWQTVFLRKNLAHLVARTSSRVFLGPELCRNSRWLEIAEGYAAISMGATGRLRQIPPLVRPFVQWWPPECRKMREVLRDTDNLIMPEVQRRKDRARQAIAEGKKPPKTADMIGWMYEVAREQREQVDYVSAQLGLSIGAIHTTTEAMAQAMVDACERPDVVEALRQEVVDVVGREGWSKQSLANLRLMDSFLKESQRLHPMNVLTMNRLVKADVALSDGPVLPSGSRIMLTTRYLDPTVYADPLTFDAYRFLREREKPKQQNAWQHVSATSTHMIWGLGKHACPGRFFASAELKVVLCHLLLKYDWRLESGPTSWELETHHMTAPTCKVQLRRRREEVDLEFEERPRGVVK